MNRITKKLHRNFFCFWIFRFKSNFFLFFGVSRNIKSKNGIIICWRYNTQNEFKINHHHHHICWNKLQILYLANSQYENIAASIIIRLWSALFIFVGNLRKLFNKSIYSTSQEWKGFQSQVSNSLLCRLNHPVQLNRTTLAMKNKRTSNCEQLSVDSWQQSLWFANNQA